MNTVAQVNIVNKYEEFDSKLNQNVTVLEIEPILSNGQKLSNSNITSNQQVLQHITNSFGSVFSVLEDIQTGAGKEAEVPRFFKIFTKLQFGIIGATSIPIDIQNLKATKGLTGRDAAQVATLKFGLSTLATGGATAGTLAALQGLRLVPHPVVRLSAIAGTSLLTAYLSSDPLEKVSISILVNPENYRGTTIKGNIINLSSGNSEQIPTSSHNFGFIDDTFGNAFKPFLYDLDPNSSLFDSNPIFPQTNSHANKKQSVTVVTNDSQGREVIKYIAIRFEL